MLPLLIFCAACFLVYGLMSTFGTIPSLRTILMFNKLPGPTNQPFFIGASWDLIKLKNEDVIPHMKQMIDRFGGICAVYGTGQPWLWVSDPDAVGVILRDSDNIQKGTEYRLLHRVLGDGIISSTGKKWWRRRRMLMPAFRFAVIQDSLACMNRHWRKIVDALSRAEGPLETMVYFKIGAFNITNEMAMGLVLDEHENASKEYVEACKRIVDVTGRRAVSNWLHNDFIFGLTPLSKSYTNDIKIFHTFNENILKQRRTEFVNGKRLEELQCSERIGKKKPLAFLDSMLALATEQNLDDSDIMEEVHTFMFAGHHTTATACDFLVMSLAENPDVQEKAYEEQLEIFGRSDRDVTHDDQSKMCYLEKVIKEALRLHPVVPQLTRMLVKDVQLPNGLIIPAGTKVTINCVLTHRDPKHWEDPETFNPERFSSEASRSRHPFSYIPFSAGPRNCIGQKLAMRELKTMASILLRSCKLSAEPRSGPFEYKMGITLESAAPIRVSVSPRKY